MRSSRDYHTKEFHFSIRPSAKELTEMDIQCFISSWTEQDYIEMKKIPFFKSWLLETQGNRSVGILAFNTIFPELEILRLGIHPKWRQRGLAELMLDHLEMFSRRQNVISIYLEVHISNNPAILLYRKKGFEDIGIRKNYFNKPQGDAIMLKKIL